MPVPQRSKLKLESVATLKQISSSAEEARQAATLMRFVANDGEVAVDTRTEANRHATELRAQPVQEDGARRDSRMMAAIQFARLNV